MTNIHAKELGKLGGRKSVEKRFLGKGKKEISEMMKRVRWTKKNSKFSQHAAKATAKALNQID